jgi:uncharacterized protein YndB with AHSA1/START domain
LPKRKPAAPIVESLAIAVPRERLWEAVTGPRVLGDIVMGHVEIDAKPGRPFVWEWGVWKHAAPGKGTHVWRGTVLDAVPGVMMVLGDGKSAATITVKGEGDSSLVTVVHAATSSSEDYQYGWADFLLRLKTRLEPIPAEVSVFHRSLIRAKPAEILRAWLSSAAVSKILPGKAKMQPRASGSFEWRWKDGRHRPVCGKFLEIVKSHRVSFTWQVNLSPPATQGKKAATPVNLSAASEVRLSAEETPYGALVSLEHLRLPKGRVTELHDRLWAHLLERLRVYFYFGRKIRTS